jgi:hypothetical protein
MHRAVIARLWLAWLALVGCASSGGSRPREAASSGAEQAAGAPPAARGDASSSGTAPALRGGASLSGLWVEFWALEGHADTQRYALFEDGRFGWCSAREGAGQGARRWGRWTADGETLVLRVEGRDQGSTCQEPACRQSHEPPIEERLQLGPCPPNEEAKALDASYRCISIAGHAFWRRSHADDPAAYFPQ